MGWETGGTGQGSEVFKEGRLVFYDFEATDYSFRIFLKSENNNE